MKRTLARSPVALRSLMTWYDLRAEVAPFLGERLTTLFAHAISAGTDCLVCSTFFRRHLIDSGENPESLQLDDWEQTIVAFGRQLAVDPHAVSDELFARLAARLRPEQIVALTAFGGLMVATNLFNNALKVDLDDYLAPLPQGGPRMSAAAIGCDDRSLRTRRTGRAHHRSGPRARASIGPGAGARGRSNRGARRRPAARLSRLSDGLEGRARHPGRRMPRTRRRLPDLCRRCPR